MYIYPDKDDLLTISLIDGISQGQYWGESENQVLSYAIAVLNEKKNVRLLDVGCGQGRLFPVFAPYVQSICGLEPDSNRFEYAQSVAEKITQIPITVKNGDISVLSDAEIFDAAILSHVLQHITRANADILLDALYRHLSPGGCIIATTTHASGDEDILTAEHFENEQRVCREVSPAEFEQCFTKDGVLPVRLFAEKSVKELFAAHGFTHLLEKKYYHYCCATQQQSAAMDAQRNAIGDGTYARDILYIFGRD